MEINETKINMSKEEVIKLMKSSRTITQWKDNCSTVKALHNNKYPEYWYGEIVLKKVMEEALKEGIDTIKTLFK